MSDPRNVAHDKKVNQEKKHAGHEAVAHAAETVQPGKKPALEHAEEHPDPATARAEAAAEQAASAAAHAPAVVERSEGE